MSDKHARLPSETFSFTLLKPEPKPSLLGPRLGTVALKNRATLQTPHYIALSSRGAVPHISQDVMRKHTNVKGIHVALEDSLQHDALLVLAPRRSPPVPCPTSNTDSAISILTSVGFRQLGSEDYVDAMRKIRPDIVLGMADLVLDQKASLKRVEKMGDRTATWTQEMMTGIADVDESNPEAHQPALFAPILPVEKELQSLYLDQLQDEWESQVQGLVVYNPSSVSIVPESLSALPRASLDEPSNPEEVLRSVSLGVDILTIPFIGAATDAGTALDFEFPCRLVNQQEPPKSLGMDMWSAQYATDLSPLRGGCPCYTCSKHHRAYVQHLLSAKEMLGWVLLQIHNHQVLDDFFAGIRSSIGKGTYEKDTERFERVYERHWPEKTGHGPRVRGYQFKSNGPGEPRKNQPAYQNLDSETDELADVPLPNPSAGASNLEEEGFAVQADQGTGNETA